MPIFPVYILVDLKMRTVTVLETRCPTHVNTFLKFAVFKFFSRIVVNKLSGIEKVHFRKWETYCTKHSQIFILTNLIN